MTFQRSMLLLPVSIVMGATLLAQPARQTFEVASVRKVTSPPNLVPVRRPARSNSFYIPAATVTSLIEYAFNIRAFELIDAPEWTRKDLFAINAKTLTELSSDEQRPLLRSLLEDRFGLVVHKDQREMRYSALALARDDGRLGPKLTKCGEPTGPASPVPIPRGGRVSIYQCAPISIIVNLATNILQIPVVDKTGLSGMWNHQLVFVDPRLEVSSGSQTGVVDPNLPALAAALREQLGFRLESRMGPVDVIVVDSVQQPSEN